jgi:hypothetical protein
MFFVSSRRNATIRLDGPHNQAFSHGLEGGDGTLLEVLNVRQS